MSAYYEKQYYISLLTEQRKYCRKRIQSNKKNMEITILFDDDIKDKND